MSGRPDRSAANGRAPDARDDRAVSITVNYVIALSITAVLISGLLIGAGGYVQDQRDRVVREELEVVGEQLAAGIDDADRLSRAEARSLSVRVGVDLPARVAGEPYRIDVAEAANASDQPARYELTLRPAESEVSVTLTVSTVVRVRNGSTYGGWTVVRLDESAGDPGKLVVEDGDASGSLSLARPAQGVR